MSNKPQPLETVKMSESEFKRLNRRSFFKWAGLLLTGGLGIRLIATSEEDRGTPWPLRRVGEFADSFWKSQFSERRAPERSEPVTSKPRLNGDIGIDPAVNGATWKMRVSSPTFEDAFEVTLADLRELPQITETIEFKCVEGWSEWMTFTGVRFTDFMEAFNFSAANLPQYAKLTSVDGEYYVAMDLKSMLHPQTLLCLSMNGEVLTPQHGFPVRLVTSVKYGVKNIKQIGSIDFTETIPSDYWAENGYGEYLGL